MYYPLYNNPFYYPNGAYMQNGHLFVTLTNGHILHKILIMNITFQEAKIMTQTIC